MRMTMLAMIATAALVAGCATDSDTTGNASGSADSTASVAQNSGPIVPGTERDLQHNIGDRIFFETDQSTINSEGGTTLARQAAWLKRYPAVTVTIEGHCDERGLREYNLALGERRATMVRQALIALGIDPSRLTTISYGKERPAVVGSDAAAWAQNRRVVTVVN